MQRLYNVFHVLKHAVRLKDVDYPQEEEHIVELIFSRGMSWWCQIAFLFPRANRPGCHPDTKYTFGSATKDQFLHYNAI